MQPGDDIVEPEASDAMDNDKVQAPAAASAEIPGALEPPAAASAEIPWVLVEPSGSDGMMVEAQIQDKEDSSDESSSNSGDSDSDSDNDDKAQASDAMDHDKVQAPIPGALEGPSGSDGMMVYDDDEYCREQLELQAQDEEDVDMSEETDDWMQTFALRNGRIVKIFGIDDQMVVNPEEITEMCGRTPAELYATFARNPDSYIVLSRNYDVD